MIAVDTSAIVAIFLQENDAVIYADRIDEDAEPVVSVATVMECSIVIRLAKRLGALDAELWLDQFLADGHIEALPVTLEEMRWRAKPM